VLSIKLCLCEVPKRRRLSKEELVVLRWPRKGEENEIYLFHKGSQIRFSNSTLMNGREVENVVAQ
jgi:hypothetical protein